LGGILPFCQNAGQKTTLGIRSTFSNPFFLRPPYYQYFIPFFSRCVYINVEMNRHGSSFGSNNCSKRVVISVFSDFCKRWILAKKGVVPIFAHPRFGLLKKPVFCLRSKFLGMLPTCLFVFFYIDFVFFFMNFAYFPIFLSNFLLEQTQIGRFRE
jgi:hypothetical protein